MGGRCMSCLAPMLHIFKAPDIVNDGAELNTGVMLLRNTDWSRQFISDVARLGRMHVNHWQLMDEVTLSVQCHCVLGSSVLQSVPETVCPWKRSINSISHKSPCSRCLCSCVCTDVQ